MFKKRKRINAYKVISQNSELVKAVDMIASRITSDMIGIMEATNHEYKLGELSFTPEVDRGSIANSNLSFGYTVNYTLTPK
jgi:hypothetical protein